MMGGLFQCRWVVLLVVLNCCQTPDDIFTIPIYQYIQDVSVADHTVKVVFANQLGSPACLGGLQPQLSTARCSYPSWSCRLDYPINELSTPSPSASQAASVDPVTNYPYLSAAF